MNTKVEDTFKSILLTHNVNDNKYLLAISGGVDSMVLLDLFKNTTSQFQVAHCNFQLRGEDANGDEELVRNYCAKHQIPFHCIRFDVEAFMQTGNYSTEMACRILRYDWFKEIIQLNHLNYLVTAHHLNDNVETFLINLSRGTGLKGLIGMQIDKDMILRPLLNCTKEDVLQYAIKNKLSWREDYTNQTDDYVRNKIRHHISPILNEIHPNFEANFLKTINFLKDTNDFVANQIEEIRKSLIKNDEYSEILISDLDQLNNNGFVQFNLFEKYGFKDVSLIDKLKLADNSSELLSKTHRLIKNRVHLILKRIENFDKKEIVICQDSVKTDDLHLSFISSDLKLDDATEIIDLKSIRFPLKLRKVKNGDYFYPLGMNGKKKMVNKYLKDQKLSKIEKEKIWLLVDDSDRIIWIVNYRLDERFKIKSYSKEFLNIVVC